MDISLDQLTRAVHGISHPFPDLWQPTPGCGCAERADAIWARLAAQADLPMIRPTPPSGARKASRG